MLPAGNKCCVAEHGWVSDIELGVINVVDGELLLMNF